ncbi:PASTA domain-containing protein, partial [Streptomyces sp. NPDC127049]|uniref:Stk1 family PASTA domain-containing Ser/Thr kinase n=1 Tax=Streptomyces sp. NPDC127049 TaxID=3347118 RepID=UPI0036567955
LLRVADHEAQPPRVGPQQRRGVLKKPRPDNGRTKAPRRPPRAGQRDTGEDRTGVIARPVPGPEAGDPHPVQHTSRLATPEPPPPARRRRTRPLPPRGPLLVVVGVLLALGLGAGVWYINAGQFTRVPAVLGQTEQVAAGRLADAGLELGTTRRAFSDVYERGTVMGVDPAPGERIRSHTTVTLTLSRGPEIVKVPNLKNKPLGEAKRILAEQGLAPGVVTTEFSTTVAQGAVIGSDPEPGTERAPDSAVALLVSKGAPVDVPDVTGETVEDATATLQEAGLKVSVAPERVHSPEDAGAVAAQSLAEGSRAAKGDTITLTVSKGPRQVEVPDVVGMTTDEAREELKAAGFEVKVEKNFPFLGDEVTGQSVEGGGTAPEGSTVAITIKGI